jgi:pimeloyl-ACP methyl ester carboxylesterase
MNHFLTINNQRVFVRACGPADGPPVLLLHGTLCSTQSWDGTLAQLGAAGLRAIAYDRPGCGLASKPFDFDYGHANLADFSVLLLDALGIERAAVVGHSAGANIAAHMALRHPQRVSRLALVDGFMTTEGGPPAAGLKLFGMPPFSAWLMLALRLIFTPPRVAALFASAYADKRNFDPTRSAGYQPTFSTPGWEIALAASFRDFGGIFLSQAQLQHITCPTLIVWGEDDRWVAPRRREPLRTAFPHATWCSYPNCGHFPMEEASESFHRDVTTFLVQL